MGPETEKRPPGAKKFNFWRPFAVMVLAFSAQVYNDSPSFINERSSTGPNHKHQITPDKLSATSFSQESPLSNVDDNPAPDPIETESISVIETMNSRPDIFSEKQIADVELYFPIYKVVAEKYGIKWYLLWIVHEAESQASTDPNAFNGASGHIGGFQRSPGWSESYVNKAAEGLEDLANFPQRDPSDWKEAAFAAWHLTTIKSEDSPLGSLIKYGGGASERYQLYQLLQQIFD